MSVFRSEGACTIRYACYSDPMIKRIKVLLELSVVRLTALVALTAVLGYRLADVPDKNLASILAVSLGTALLSAGGNALNQCMEADTDALMKRTCNRPLPAGRIALGSAARWALFLALGGFALLLLFTNPLTAGLGLLALAIYLFAYTPLKKRSSLNTVVGAVSGALPPMMGWTAASASLDLGAWILGLLLFLWQIPHFLALAWLFREDYAKAGFRMLPGLDPSGRITSRVAFLYIVLLLPLISGFYLSGLAGLVATLGGLSLCLFFLLRAWQLMQNPNARNARRLFLASVIFLPLLIVLLLADPGTGKPAERISPPAIVASH